jgi:hypothetical protein
MGKVSGDWGSGICGGGVGAGDGGGDGEGGGREKGGEEGSKSISPEPNVFGVWMIGSCYIALEQYWLSSFIKTKG